MDHHIELEASAQVVVAASCPFDHKKLVVMDMVEEHLVVRGSGYTYLEDCRLEAVVDEEAAGIDSLAYQNKAIVLLSVLVRPVQLVHVACSKLQPAAVVEYQALGID